MDFSAGNNPLRVFSNRDYSLYFAGQLVSQAGTWMQMVALSWLTYEMTKSPALLTVVTASSQVPSLLIMPWAGVLADRLNRRLLLIITQVLFMLEAAILAALVISNTVQVWHLIALGILSGTIFAFDMPTRAAFVADLTKDRKEDIPAAVAMNSTLMNATRLIGPALAGLIVAKLGAGVCFLLNSLSYLPVILTMILIKTHSMPQKHSGSFVNQLTEGFTYMWRTPALKIPLLLTASFGVGGMAYQTLLPVFVKQIGGDAGMLGLFMSISAGGSLLGSFLIATRKDVRSLAQWMMVCCFISGITLVVLGMANSFWFASATLAVIGLSMMVQLAGSMSLVQSVVEDNKRGRVMSMMTTAFMGTAPIGALIAGQIADRFGFSKTMMLCGAYCVAVAILFMRKLPASVRDSALHTSHAPTKAPMAK